MKISDDKFVQEFRRHGGVDQMARATGMNRRSIQRRRAKMIEQGIDLPLGGTVADDRWSTPPRIGIEVDSGSVVVFSDAHWYAGQPRSRANSALLRLCRKLRPAAVIANGDILDAPQISSHAPIGWKRDTSLADDISLARERLDEIAESAQGARLLRTVGNHDIRYDRRLATVASEFRGVSGMRLRDHLPGWDECWSVFINEDVVVKHRWHGGLSATWSNTVKGGLTMVTGHLHRLTVSPHRDYTGRRWGVDTGTLSEIDGPEYEYAEASPLNWASGFCVLTFVDGMLLPPELAETIGDRVWFRGRAI